MRHSIYFSTKLETLELSWIYFPYESKVLVFHGDRFNFKIMIAVTQFCTIDAMPNPIMVLTCLPIGCTEGGVNWLSPFKAREFLVGLVYEFKH